MIAKSLRRNSDGIAARHMHSFVIYSLDWCATSHLFSHDVRARNPKWNTKVKEPWKKRWKMEEKLSKSSTNPENKCWATTTWGPRVDSNLKWTRHNSWIRIPDAGNLFAFPLPCTWVCCPPSFYIRVCVLYMFTVLLLTLFVFLVHCSRSHTKCRTYLYCVQFLQSYPRQCQSLTHPPGPFWCGSRCHGQTTGRLTSVVRRVLQIIGKISEACFVDYSVSLFPDDSCNHW